MVHVPYMGCLPGEEHTSRAVSCRRCTVRLRAGAGGCGASVRGDGPVRHHPGRLDELHLQHATGHPVMRTCRPASISRAQGKDVDRVYTGAGACGQEQSSRDD